MEPDFYRPDGKAVFVCRGWFSRVDSSIYAAAWKDDLTRHVSSVLIDEDDGAVAGFHAGTFWKRVRRA